MTRVPASDHFVIEMSSARWRLLLKDETREKVLAEATTGRSLRYVNSFADKRRLPAGNLPSGLIRQVVLGFSSNDAAWHLGLMLSPDLAEKRGSRWCELVRWRQDEIGSDTTAAQQTGETLAQILEVPFRVMSTRSEPSVATQSVIPGRSALRPDRVERPSAISAPIYAPSAPRDTEIAPAPVQTDVEEAPVVEEKPLPQLPIKSGMWTLERTADGKMQLVRSGRWAMGRITRILWYTFWTIVYIMISVATLTTKLALPNSGTLLPDPKILPILGLATAAVLFLLILKNVYDLLTEIGRITIDPESRTITALAGTSESWHLEADEIEAVYVSQVVSQRGDRETLHHGEINLYLAKGIFRPVLVQPDNDEKVPVSRSEARDRSRPKDGLLPLTRDEARSSLQSISLYIARTLGVPAWYDRRTS